MDYSTEKNDIKTYLIILNAFTLLNLFLHYVNFYIGFIDSIVDYGLYAAKILICVQIYMATKYEDNALYRTLASIIRLMVVLDVLEVIISLTMVSMEGIAGILLYVLIAAKIVLDYFLYNEFMNEKRTRIVWMALHAAIIGSFFLTIKWYYFFIVFAALIIARFISAIFYIKKCDLEYAIKSERGLMAEIARKTSSPDRYYKTYAILGILLLCFSALYFSKTTFEYNKTVFNDGLIKVQDDMYQYRVSNKMPKWSGFHRDWWGLINIKTGEQTNATHRERLKYDDAGLAWDFAGHFIDYQGNVVISVDHSVLKKSTARTTMMISLVSFLRDDRYEQGIDIYNYKNEYVNSLYWTDIFGFADGARKNARIRWDDLDKYSVSSGNIISSGQFITSEAYDSYFTNHIAIFYSEANGAYGLINDKGKVISRPAFLGFSSEYGFEVIPVVKKITGRYGVLNDNGDYILEGNVDYNILTNKKNIVWWRKEDEFDGYKIMDFSGKDITDGRKFVHYDPFYGDVTSFDMEYVDDEISFYKEVALDCTGKEVFSSDLYSGYISYKSTNGEIKYLLARQKENSQWVLIDTAGNIVSEHEYSDLYVVDENEPAFVVCEESDSLNTDIVFFNGKIVKTQYQYCGYDKNLELIKVQRKKKGSSNTYEYNYIDLKGHLVGIKWQKK